MNDLNGVSQIPISFPFAGQETVDCVASLGFIECVGRLPRKHRTLNKRKHTETSCTKKGQ